MIDYEIDNAQSDAKKMFVWQYFAIENHTDAKKGWAKNAF